MKPTSISSWVRNIDWRTRFAGRPCSLLSDSSTQERRAEFDMHHFELDVEQEMADVAVLHHVRFAFDA